ncbi:hypothetical protein [Methanosarcina sp. 2.H.A.1B.4]|uniref:hypothetical protein n=1 Tax=Methanosarcina sp. 2.H.A.1B.4 TaxID=1483600 RepID=UPI000620E89B|nr:hypothetical protein [Methanosarcina sp. 2.H.A.1B.4]KKG10462.1 hypothetical protein EO92_05610 [Methanosarcina sp. 2.H.A.1B.4]
MQDTQNEIKINIDQAQMYQAQRLLTKIETASLTTEYKQALSGLVKRYFYMNYDNCPRQFARFVINSFKFDLTYAQTVCTQSDNLVVSELKNDILSTFKIIINKAVDYRTVWEKISGKIESKIGIINL